MAELRKNELDRWMIYRDSEPVHEVTSGDVIKVEVKGCFTLLPTRIEYDHSRRDYTSVQGYDLWNGMRAEPH
jgi:hypothetical protein